MTDLTEHPMKLVSGFRNSFFVVAIHHKDKTLCVLKVVSPQWSNLQVTKQLMNLIAVLIFYSHM